MALVVALGVLAVLAVVMLVFVGIERGPEPVDVAVAYELAWRRRDYATLFDLSAKELRDGLARDEFVAAKRASDAKADVATDATMSDVASVDLASGDVASADAAEADVAEADVAGADVAGADAVNAADVAPFTHGAVTRVRVDEVVAATDSALVVTRAEGEDLRHRVMCERRQGRWQVVGYNLVTSDP